MRIMQTESECGDGNNSFKRALYIADLIRQYFKHGAERYTYWNIALKSGGQSTWGWKQNSLAVVEGKHIKLQPEFYVMKHFSKFIEPGAYLLNVKGEMSANSSAFLNSDGSYAIVVSSLYDDVRNFTVKGRDFSFNAKIEPKSINTFIVR